MTTAKQLRDKFEKDLKQLQDNCKHEPSDWMEHVWAPSHYSGFQVKQCNNCWKIIKYKTYCISCRKEIITDEQKNSYQNDCLCDDCSKKGKYYCFEHKNFHNNPRGCDSCFRRFNKIKENEKVGSNEKRK